MTMGASLQAAGGSVGVAGGGAAVADGGADNGPLLAVVVGVASSGEYIVFSGAPQPVTISAAMAAATFPRMVADRSGDHSKIAATLDVGRDGVWNV